MSTLPSKPAGPSPLLKFEAFMASTTSRSASSLRSWSSTEAGKSKLIDTARSSGVRRTPPILSGLPVEPPHRPAATGATPQSRTRKPRPFTVGAHRRNTEWPRRPVAASGAFGARITGGSGQRAFRDRGARRPPPDPRMTAVPRFRRPVTGKSPPARFGPAPRGRRGCPLPRVARTGDLDRKGDGIPEAGGDERIPAKPNHSRSRAVEMAGAFCRRPPPHEASAVERGS